MPLRHIPERTCVACRSLRPKREMVRVVRTTAGAVVVDPTGKQSGRGAYLCRLPDCWRTALRRKALERALKTELSDADGAALERYQRSALGPQSALVTDPQVDEHPVG
ncbi:MAG: YlxR family protein [Chloroflexi bacterium]|nr:YlxR family protein [Chloroflexota bacterium]